MTKISTSRFIFMTILLCALSFYSGFFISGQKSAGPKVDTSKAVKFTPVKSDKPELKFYVMSFCPYGNQIEDTLRPVFDLLKNKVNLTPHYIFEKVTDLNSFCLSRSGDVNECPNYVKSGYFKNLSECKTIISQNLTACKDEKSYLKAGNGTLYSSLHGRQEGNQDVREICAWNQVGDDKTAWWNFIAAVNKNCTADVADTCWEQQGKAAGLDTNKITECFNKDAFTLIDKEIEATTKYKVSGSPTVFINDVIFPPESAYTQDGKGTLLIGKKIATQDKYRTPEVLKNALCASLKKSDKACDTVLPDIVSVVPATGGCAN